jgi:hypothetical protein
MKYFLILLTVATFTSARAQITEDSVRIAVSKMFTCMKNADAALLKSCFADSAILQTITRDKEGNVIVKNESIAEFIGFVSKQSPGAADERITFETIKIDGPLAIAWTPYNFYFSGQFSHCGVNSFQLVRLHGEWKIQYIIDTRRRQCCKNE